ncbi:MAG: cell division protein FtsZ [Rhodothermia bacterium]|nr:MAG: cell division protein FtsZ [Rhodothermia bacterium]
METSFSTSFAFDDTLNEEAKICVIGVGGGGGNAVDNMIEKGIGGVDFWVVNTDLQSLAANLAPSKIQAGIMLTKGLGAGAIPSVGAEAIEESRTDIENALQGFDMVFITAGMGGGTGTGGVPIVAQIAKDLGILSVAIVTKPFECEGKRRMAVSENGIDRLKEEIDTLIIIPNERLLDISEATTTLVEAFVKADEVLYNATRGISDLITVHGLINLDFADVRTTMTNGGTALMGASTASGENRAERAATEALSSPLLDGVSIHGAKNVLVNITAGRSLGIREATAATGIIQKEAGDDVEVIFGTVIDESMAGDLRITVIATGFDMHKKLDGAARRKSLPLHADIPIAGYKGEENLKQLDVPAYRRRQATVSIAPVEGVEDDTVETQRGVRRLNSEEIQTPERILKGDTDVPAFLRKMMD